MYSVFYMHLPLSSDIVSGLPRLSDISLWCTRFDIFSYTTLIHVISRRPLIAFFAYNSPAIGHTTSTPKVDRLGKGNSSGMSPGRRGQEHYNKIVEVYPV